MVGRPTESETAMTCVDMQPNFHNQESSDAPVV